MQPSAEPLIAADAIQSRVAEMAARITREHDGRRLLLLVVLKGSVVFAVDLMRALAVPVTLDFIRAKSYDGTSSSGRVIFSHLPEHPLQGEHVLMVEDIIDTGRTAAAIAKWVSAQHPASLAVCTLLDKPSRREVEVPVHYTGFVIDDHFVVGYGLDHEERHRELPDIRVLV